MIKTRKVLMSFINYGSGAVSRTYFIPYGSWGAVTCAAATNVEVKPEYFNYTISLHEDQVSAPTSGDVTRR